MAADAETDKPSFVVLKKDTLDNPFYLKDVASKLRPSIREMLEQYAGVPSNKIIEHIEKARARSWEVAPFPSIGLLTWLFPMILVHESHDAILAKVKAGASIVDCGCMVAPDLRQLAFEGAPTQQMHGFDIEAEFFDIGFEYFNDRERWKGKWYTVDGTADVSTTALAPLRGKIDVIWCTKFLHLFHRSKQIEVAARLIQLLRPQPGSMFVGSQVGAHQPIELSVKGGLQGMGSTFWTANVEAMKEAWEEVAQLTGTTWKVEGSMLDLESVGLWKSDGTVSNDMIRWNLQWTATLLEAPVGG